jgi:P-type Ca2+ transporter type 2C
MTGADVTKKASDIVLMDDNFASIVHAVEEGRGIFDNIQKFVHYLLACNTGEILFMFWSALVDWPVPLMPIQILWINLVTDGLPALALAMEPPEADIMSRPPRPPREPVITWRRGLVMLFHGVLIAAATAIGFQWIYAGDPSRLNEARVTAFCILAYSQLFYSFGCRSQNSTLPQLGLFSNLFLFGSIFASALLQLAIVTVPLARDFFHITNFQTLPWATLLGLSLAPVTIIELIKLIHAAVTRKSRNTTHAS